MKGALFGTRNEFALLLLRLTLAVVIFPHGAQKVLGWFGGYGWDGTMGFLTGKIGLPTALAALVILIEFLGPVALLLGFCTRLAALGVLAVMVGAIQTVHRANGFFMNWNNTPGAGEGFEYHLLAIGIALALMLLGGGALSVDRKLAPR
ncbi:MAG TPA: DoxX family protein [Planctomycetota bacterium]|nr:DoxX family protein [Planctomycetota bacterium]